MLKLPKQLLKSVTLVDDRAGEVGRENSPVEYSTMQFKDTRVEKYFLKLAYTIRQVLPREAKLMISSIKHHYYMVERCTSNNQKVVRCEFRTPRFGGYYAQYDSQKYDDCGSRNWIQVEIIPSLDIYEITQVQAGSYYGKFFDKTFIIFRDRLLQISHQDKGYLDHYKDTYWEVKRLEEEQRSGGGGDEYWTRRKRAQSVTYAEAFDLYCQYNPSIEFKEDL